MIDATKPRAAPSRGDFEGELAKESRLSGSSSPPQEMTHRLPKKATVFDPSANNNCGTPSIEAPKFAQQSGQQQEQKRSRLQRGESAKLQHRSGGSSSTCQQGGEQQNNGNSNGNSGSNSGSNQSSRGSQQRPATGSGSEEERGGGDAPKAASKAAGSGSAAVPASNEDDEMAEGNRASNSDGGEGNRASNSNGAEGNRESNSNGVEGNRESNSNGGEGNRASNSNGSDSGSGSPYGGKAPNNKEPSGRAAAQLTGLLDISSSGPVNSEFRRGGAAAGAVDAHNHNHRQLKSGDNGWLLRAGIPSAKHHSDGHSNATHPQLPHPKRRHEQLSPPLHQLPHARVGEMVSPSAAAAMAMNAEAEANRSSPADSAQLPQQMHAAEFSGPMSQQQHHRSQHHQQQISSAVNLAAVLNQRQDWGSLLTMPQKVPKQDQRSDLLLSGGAGAADSDDGENGGSSQVLGGTAASGFVQLGSASYAGGSDQDGSRSDRTLKRSRIVWTPELHHRFMAAVHQLGVNNAVPKNLLQARGYVTGREEWHSG